jgi:hypothetical protein
MKRWDSRGRHWNSDTVHFWWESPLTAIILLGVYALVMAVLR